MGDRSRTMPPKKKDDKKGATGASKKSMKDFLAKTKSGASKSKKKWSKGKVREKLNNAVTFKLVTPSVISERLKVNGSLARRAIQQLLQAGSIRCIDKHSAQMIYTRNTGDEADQ